MAVRSLHSGLHRWRPSRKSTRLLAAAGEGATLAGPVGTTPPILRGGSGSGRQRGLQLASERRSRQCWMCLPGPGRTDNWLGKETRGAVWMTDKLTGKKGNRERSIHANGRRAAISLDFTSHFEDHKQTPVSREMRPVAEGQ